MQITSYSIATPGSQCISWDEPVDVSVTVKMDSSQQASASASSVLLVNLIFNNVYDFDGTNVQGAPGSFIVYDDYDISIGKGESKKFTSSANHQWKAPNPESFKWFSSGNRKYGDIFLELTGDGGTQRAYPCALCVKVDDNNMTDHALEVVKDSVITFLLSRLDPTIDSYSYSDGHALNPLGHFGAYVQNRSVPHMQFSVTLDPLDPSLTAVHKLTLTSPDGAPKDYESPDGAFVLDVPTQSGTYSWSYAVTDSAGNSAAQCGSFDVLAYAPPRFDTMTVQRYTESVDDEGKPIYIATDDGNHVWITVDAAVAQVAGKNAWTLKRLRDDTGGEITLLSGADGETIRRINDRALDSEVYSSLSTIGVTLSLSDFFETVERYEVILKAGGYAHITKNGTAVGMRSTATPEQKKFEVAEDHEGFFYGGVQSFGLEDICTESQQALGIEYGTTGANAISVPGDSTVNQTFTFSRPFSSPPVVIASRIDSRVAWSYVMFVRGTADETTCTISLTNGNSSTSTMGANWIAIGPR